VTGAELYPSLPAVAAKLYYKCNPCQAWGSSGSPMQIANAELRTARRAAHFMFDPMWKSRAYSRAAAYQWLAQRLGLTSAECHIGLFDVAMCEKVVEVCEKHYRQEQ
jgi:zinc-finger-containing domain